MQVKISFTVDLEEVPLKVDKLINETMLDLRDIYESNVIQLNEENAIKKINWLDKTRRELLKLDTRLADCYHILVGYNKAIAQNLAPQEEVAKENVEENIENVPSES